MFLQTGMTFEKKRLLLFCKKYKIYRLTFNHVISEIKHTEWKDESPQTAGSINRR